MWKILSIFPPTYFTVKTTVGGHELERQGISVLSHFPHSTVCFSFGLLPLLPQHLGGLIGQTLYHLYSFLAKKKGIPYEIEFPMDMSLRFMNKFLTNKKHIGAVTWCHFVPWSQERSLRTQFHWECCSIKPFTVLRTNSQEPTMMAFKMDCILVQVENGFLLHFQPAGLICSWVPTPTHICPERPVIS